MDPHKNYESAGSWIHYNIYETLFTYEWDSADTTPSNPLLATGVTISSDGKTYTFTLREGVTFHDGTAFNATAVQMNFWRMLGRGWDDGWGPVWMIAEPIKGGQAVEDAVYEYGDGSAQHIGNWTEWKDNSDAVTVVSEYVVEVELEYAFTPFLPALTYEVGAMISPTYFMAHGGMAPGGDSSWMDEHACGTGPYELVEWVQDDKVDITLYDNYWRATDAKAQFPNAGAVKDVTFKLNAETNSRLLNLQSGTIDGAYWPKTHAYQLYNNVTGDPGDGTLQSLDPNLKVWAGLPTFDVMFLGFNMHEYLNKTTTEGFEITLSPWKDINARLAVSYAFDYETAINTIVNGFGQQMRGPIPDGMLGYSTDVDQFSYDLDEAVTHWNLAMTAGLDDIWANNSYELNIYYNEGNAVREAAALLLKDGIEAILADPSATPTGATDGGLDIDVVALEWASYLYQVRNKQLPIFWLGWAPDYADPDNYASPFVRSTGTFPSRVGLAGSLGADGIPWDYETVDGWIIDAAKETDATTRENYYKQMADAIVAHAAFIWCYQATTFHVERVEMNGYVFNPMHDPYFYHYYKTA
jgi:peptide/nickel transport system substrate-binding protein